MKIYNACNKPKGCCPAVSHDEENDLYRLYDNEFGWSSNDITFEQLIQIKYMITVIENDREDIKNLD